MEKERRKYISNVTKVIRDSFKLSTPIDLHELVTKLDGQLEFSPHIENGIEAKIEKLNDSFKISIDPSVYDKRVRFSIAHELGHLFLHMGYLINPTKWSSTDDYCDSVYYRYGYNIEEYEANEFAAALLMPSDEFIEIAEKNLALGSYEIEKIAKHFDVSTEAALNRGKFLGLFRWMQ